jgi:dephospho-CoA kinase
MLSSGRVDRLRATDTLLAAMLRVGLTGGIACGKSLVLRQFEELGAYTIDADSIAHRVILPGHPAYQEIVDTFGASLLAEDRTIDRRRLGRLVFGRPQALQSLNRIVHPQVAAEVQNFISRCEADHPRRSPIVMVDAALMFETGSYRRYDLTVAVYCCPTAQLQRLMSRDGYSEAEARLRIESQLPAIEKAKQATFVVDNSGSPEDTREQVAYLYEDLRCRERERAAGSRPA